MTDSSTKQVHQPTRFQRYKAILDCVVPLATFDIDCVKTSCINERPGFITRVMGELERDGWIVREHDGAEDSQSVPYRWNSGKGVFQPQRWLDNRLYGVQITESPKQDRPRERLLTNGAEALTTAELLAILIRSGRPGESAVMGGEKVAKKFDHRLQDLPAAGRGELKDISIAVEKTAFCQIMAGIELGRRVATAASKTDAARICSSADAIAFCKTNFSRLIADAKQEEFHIVTLNTKNHVIDTHAITIGTLDASLVHPREVFRPAIKDAAASVILVHNHPSGDPTPSREDHAVTKRLELAGEVIGIDVLDHIVLGKTAVSIRES